MFKRIMVALDAEKQSNLVLTKAIDLAKNQKAKLCIVHVIDYRFMAAGAEGMNIEALRDNIKKAGEKILKKAVMKANKKGIKAEAQLIEFSQLMKDIPDMIIKTATKWRSSLLVIGSHEKSLLDRFLLGSAADSIIRRTNIPILLIHSKKKVSWKRT